MSLRLPIPLANHIAKVCGLPGLFIGEYEGTAIEYIWVAKFEGAFDLRHGIIPSLIIVIESNQWTRGIFAHGGKSVSTSDKVSAIVDLSDWGDTVNNILQAHDKIPRDESDTFALDGYTLAVAYLTSSKSNSYYISNPESHSKVAYRLDVELTSIRYKIISSIKQNEIIEGSQFNYIEMLNSVGHQTRLSPFVSPSRVETRHYILQRIPLGFLQIYKYVHKFQLSGLFHSGTNPHDLEYILLVHIVDGGEKLYFLEDWNYVIVKTSRWLRGGRYRRSIDYPMVDIPDEHTNWKSLINNLGGYIQADSERKVHIVRFIESTNQTFGEYDELDTSPKSVEAWHKIENLIKLLEQSNL